VFCFVACIEFRNTLITSTYKINKIKITVTPENYIFIFSFFILYILLVFVSEKYTRILTHSALAYAYP